MSYFANQNRFRDFNVVPGGDEGGRQQNTSHMGGWRGNAPQQISPHVGAYSSSAGGLQQQGNMQHLDIRNTCLNERLNGGLNDNPNDRPSPRVSTMNRNDHRSPVQQPHSGLAGGNSHERTSSGNLMTGLPSTPVNVSARNVPPPAQKENALKSKDIDVLEREIMSRAHNMVDVQEICRGQARFQHFVTRKGFAQAKKMMIKKPKHFSEGRPFSCQTCDEYYPNKYDFDSHLKGYTHREICHIYGELEDIGESVLKKKENQMGTVTSVLLNTSQNEPSDPPQADPYQRPPSAKIGPASVQPIANGSTNKLREDLLSLEPLTMEKEDFILASYEKVMSEYWPLPNSDFYCRCCNYAQFKSESLLNIHLKSARHLDYERNYGLAFCLSCQFHTGDEDGMHVHLQSSSHIEIQNMMDVTRLEALRIWEETQIKSQLAGDQQSLPASTTIIAVPADVQPIPVVDSSVAEEVVTNQKIPSDKTKDEKERRNSRGAKDVDRSHGGSDRRKSDHSSGRGTMASDRSRGRKTDSAKKDDKKKSATTDKKDTRKMADRRGGDRKRSHSKEGDKNVLAKKKAGEEVGVKSTVQASVTAVAHTSPDVVIIDEEPEKAPMEVIEADSFVIPLPGFMCTVCAETLPNELLAMAHINAEPHSQKVLEHKKKLGLVVEAERVTTPEQPQRKGTKSPAAKRRANPLSHGDSQKSGRQADATPVAKKEPYRQSGPISRAPAPAPEEQASAPTNPPMFGRGNNTHRQPHQGVQQNYDMNSREEQSPASVSHTPAEVLANAQITRSVQPSQTVTSMRQSYGSQPTVNQYIPSNAHLYATLQQPSTQPIKKQADLWNSASKPALQQNNNKLYNRGFYNRGLDQRSTRGSRY